MKPILTQRMMTVLFVLLVSPTVIAGITDIAGAPVQETDYLFGSIQVTSRVYTIGNLYLYTYDLTNPLDSLQSASWFSVAIAPGVDIVSVGYDTSQTKVVPAVWHDIGNPIVSIDAQFLSTINPGQSSTTLYYLSAQRPGKTSASMGGIAETGSFVCVNPITSPVPEPATVLLLSAGAFLSVRRRNRSGTQYQ